MLNESFIAIIMATERGTIQGYRLMIVIIIFLAFCIFFDVFFKISPLILAIALGLSIFGGYQGIRKLQNGIKTVDYPDPDLKNGRKKIIVAILMLIVSVIACVFSVRGLAFFIC